MNTNTHLVRPALIAGAAFLGIALCAHLVGAVASGKRKGPARGLASATGARAATHAGSRIPLVSRLLSTVTYRSEEPRAAAPAPANGGWTLAECLAGQRRPDASSELAALTSATGDATALPEELARALALAATDRAYHDALARATALSASPAEALRLLESALAETPDAHRVARIRLLAAMLPLARTCRPVAEKLALAARLDGEHRALLELAAAAGVVESGPERAVRQDLEHGRGTLEALEPLLAGLLDRGPSTVGGAD